MLTRFDTRKVGSLFFRLPYLVSFHSRCNNADSLTEALIIHAILV